MCGNVIECEKESFRFKSKKCSAHIKELKSFVNDLIGTIKSINFRKIDNNLQTLMKAHVAKVKALPNLLISSNETKKLYNFSPTEYKKLLKDNITKTYKQRHLV